MNTKNFSNQGFLTAGILTGISASLCCITPVVGILGGIGGIASAFNWLEPYRPYLVGMTSLFIGFAWYKKLNLQRKAVIDCECETDEKQSFLQSKLFLGIVTLLTVIFVTFPYYSRIFFSSTNSETITVDNKNIAIAEIEIEGMTCSTCEYSVNKAIGSLPGIFEVKSNHRTGLIKVKYDKSKLGVNDFPNKIKNKVGYTILNIKMGE